jgi:hypothetical protein
VETQPCPHCGGTQIEGNRCQTCGRPYDADLAKLAMFQRWVASLEQKKRSMTADQLVLRNKLAHVSAQRDSLAREIRQRQAAQEASMRGGLRQRLPRVVRRTAREPGPTAMAAPAPPVPPPVPAGVPGQRRVTPSVPEEGRLPRAKVIRRRLPPPAGQPLEPPDRTATGTPRTITDGPPPGVAPLRATSHLAGAETTTRSTQNVLLALGGFLLAGAAIVLAVVAFASFGAIGRVSLLTLITVIALALPVRLARRGLTATGETLAAVALLMVLLDGYVAWLVGLFGASSIPESFYFGLICATTAAIAMIYTRVSHLVAPRFATLLVIQPILPLLTAHWVSGSVGRALVFTAVAAIDLTIAAGLVVDPAPRAATNGGEPSEALEPDSAPTPAWARVPALLHELTWFLYAIAFGIAVAYGTAALATTDTLPATLGAATVVLLTAAVGLGGGLALRRGPLPDLSAGLATLAVIAAVTRVGAVALPGHLPLFAAGAVALAALVVPVLPSNARRGPRVASGLAAAAVAVLVLLRAGPVIEAPLRAVLPIWRANLATYHATLAEAAHPAGYQVAIAAALLTAAAAFALPSWVRVNAVVVGATLTILTLPGGFALSPVLGPTVLVAGAIAFAVVARSARLAHVARDCVLAAAAVGGYAIATSLTRPGTTALVLAAITVAGVAIATPQRPRPDAYAEAVAQAVADAAAGAAAFAFPGAVASGVTALLHMPPMNPTGVRMVLASTFLAVAASLGFAAAILVARRRSSPPLLFGSTGAAAGVAVAAALAPGTTLVDLLLGLLLLAGAVSMWFAPRIGERRLLGLDVDGPDLSAAIITAGVIVTVGRVVSLGVPGFGLVTLAFLVLLLAVAVNGLSPEWRRGPIAGGVLVGGAVAATTGFVALAGGIGVIRAAGPVWHADIGPHWWRVASQYSEFGWQVPVALLAIAAAAAIALPSPLRDDATAGTIGLAAIGAPVSLGLPWWAPMLVGVVTATGLGISAVFARLPRAGYSRAMVAAIVGLYAAAASLVRPEPTAATTAGLAFAGAIVAAIASQLVEFRETGDPTAYTHLTTIGGISATGALVALTAAVAATAAGEQHLPDLVLSAAISATSIGLAVAALLCWRNPVLLAYVTAGVAISALITTLVAIPLATAPSLYAAAAALLGVLAELLRSNARRRMGWRPEDGWRPARGWRPDRTWLPARAWRPDRPGGGFATGVALASGLPAILAVILVGPAVLAALFGPYRWIERVWTGTPDTASDLGWFNRWVGTGTDVLALAVLTLAAALAAVGLAGHGRLATSRVTTTIIPGIGLTLLIAPSALGAPWPAGPTAALLVATLAGLGLALTEPAPPEEAGRPLRNARRVVFLLAVLAAGAGMTGSLATRSQLITALAGSVVVGLIGALGGHSMISRLLGWQVACGAATLLALAAGLAAGLPRQVTAFWVLAVAAVTLAFAAALPRFRRTDTLGHELLVIESAGYTGAGFAVALTLGSTQHTAAACAALGAVLGLAAGRPGRGDAYRRTLIIAGALSELAAIWLLLRQGQVSLLEAYTLPFALVALLVGLLEIRAHPELGSWLAYGPALVVGFLPTLVVVLTSDSNPARRILLIVGAVLTLAVGSLRRQKAPVVVGSVVTTIATLHELILLGRFLPAWVLVVLFSATGLLLVGLGATYERRRRQVRRLRGALGRMR